MSKQKPETSVLPALEPHCGSWVCSRNAGERFETFSRRTAEYAAAHGYRVETAASYLSRINRESSPDTGATK